MSNAWYQTGYQGLKEQEEQATRAFRPDHFWIGVNQSSSIVFLDDEPFTIREHNPKIGNSFKNWETCLAGVHDDVACCDIMGHRTAYFVGYYTVVVTSAFTSSSGKTYQNMLKLLPAKTGSMKMLKSKKDKRGSLIGCQYSVSRYDEKQPNIGSEFEFDKEVNMDELFKVTNYNGKMISELFAKNEAWLRRTFQFPEGKAPLTKLTPFNYFNILKPKTPREIRSLWAAYRPEGSEPESEKTDSSNSPEGADETVPF